MDKKIVIEIGNDGKIYAETMGIKGKQCLSYIELIEKLLDAETIDSDYKDEYLQEEVVEVESNIIHTRRND